MRDNQRRERLNVLVRAELKRDGRLGESVHVGGHEFAVGDRVVARRNDREREVDNGMRGTVIAVDQVEKDLVVRTDAGAQRRLDAPYVAEHLQHAYALTAHTSQGATVEWAGVVGRPEDFTRNWSYAIDIRGHRIWGAAAPVVRMLFGDDPALRDEDPVDAHGKDSTRLKKQTAGWFARWRERRRRSARKAAEVQVRMDDAHRRHLGGTHSDPRGPGERGGGMGGI